MDSLPNNVLQICWNYLRTKRESQDDAHALHSTNRGFRYNTSEFIKRMVLLDPSKDSFECWPRLAKLRVLEIHYEHLDMRRIADLPGALQILTNVTKLTIGKDTRINSDDMDAIARACPSLECLHLGLEGEFYSEDGYITAEDGDILRHLHDLPRLRTLFVDFPHDDSIPTIWNNLIASLSSLPARLSKVDLCFGGGTYGGEKYYRDKTLRQCIDVVSTVPGLHGLSGFFTPDTSTTDWFSGLDKISTLRKLDYWNALDPSWPVNMPNLASLLNCSKLTDLTMFQCNLSGDATVAVLEMPSLVILSLTNMNVVLPRRVVRTAPLEDLYFTLQDDDWTPILSLQPGLTNRLHVYSHISRSTPKTMHITTKEDASRVPDLMAIMGQEQIGIDMHVHLAKDININFIPCIEPLRLAFGAFTLHHIHTVRCSVHHVSEEIRKITVYS